MCETRKTKYLNGLTLTIRWPENENVFKFSVPTYQMKMSRHARGTVGVYCVIVVHVANALLYFD